MYTYVYTFACWLCHLLAVWRWVKPFISWCFGTSIWKAGPLLVGPVFGCKREKSLSFTAVCGGDGGPSRAEGRCLRAARFPLHPLTPLRAVGASQSLDPAQASWGGAGWASGTIS